MAEDRIIGFYSGQQADHRGRQLHEIQSWPDGKLETVHDYIQWLFPLPGDSLRFGFESLWIADYKKGLLSRIAIHEVLSQ